MGRPHLTVLILAGGRGERLWPASRRARPKPFVDFGTGGSLLFRTFARAARLAPPSNIHVVVGREQVRSVRRELRGHGAGSILVEPEQRNTGPAALLGSRLIWEKDPEAEILVLPADHHIEGSLEFRRAVSDARRLARRGFLVVFGVRPRGPLPDFGYAVPGDRLSGSAFRVDRFVEKPAPALARRLIGLGAKWNSGMFVWRAGDFLAEAGRTEPAFRRWLRNKGPRHGLDPAARRGFRRLPALPVDRAVLERSSQVAMIPARFEWSDLGTWDSLALARGKDRRGNVGWGRLVARESSGNLAYHPNGLTVLWGVNELLVVRSGKILMVCPRRLESGLRDLLRHLREIGLDEYL